MTKQDIDNIVWWIPFRKTRNSIRELLLCLVDSEYKFDKSEYNLPSLSNISNNTAFLPSLNHHLWMLSKISPFVKHDFIYKFSYIKKDLSRRAEIRFYLPDYPKDLIQNAIVGTANFFDIDTIESVDKYFADNSVILDIGGNIGNHSIYWSMVRKAKKIIAFEPCKALFDVFQKNVEINHLEDTITLHNFALGEEESKASPVPNFSNLGGTHIDIDDNGSVEVKVLDDVDLGVSNIDFIKIDVEGFELFVLRGAVKTISKYKPVLMIEVLEEKKLQEIKSFFNNLNYELILSLCNNDFIFAPKK